MKAKLFRLALVVVLLSAVVAFVTPAQQSAEAAGISISCTGNLIITAGPYVDYPAENVYWVDGDGPGLPTAKQTLGNSTYLTWELSGPGSWSNLVLYWSRGDGGGVSEVAYSAVCAEAAPGCVANVYIPSTAVVGSITDNAAVFQMPDPNTMTNIVLTIGKTFWMDGVDSTGMYRKVLISCEWVWVEASKTGPNYDDVWNGTPLPTNIVD